MRLGLDEALQIIEKSGMRIDERELTPEQIAARRARAKARREKRKSDKKPKYRDYSNIDDYKSALFDYLGRVVSPDDFDKETEMYWKIEKHVIVEYGDVREALVNHEELHKGYFWLSNKEYKNVSIINDLLDKKFGKYGWYRAYFPKGDNYYYNPTIEEYQREILPRREAEKYLERGEIPPSIKYNGQGFGYTNPVYTEFCKLPGAKPLLDSRAKEEEKRKKREKDNIWWNGRGDFLKAHPEASNT